MFLLLSFLFSGFTATVEIQKRSLLLLFLSTIRLEKQSLELVLSNPTATKLMQNDNKDSTIKGFFFFYCRFRKIKSWNDSRKSAFCLAYCHFL